MRIPTDPSSQVRRHGELVAQVGLRDLRRAVRDGSLHRVAHGWYTTEAVDAALLTALRLGGRLTCLSAAAAHGLLVPPISRPHVAFRRATPIGKAVAAHPVRRWGFSAAVAPVDEALCQVINHHDPELALIAVESALDKGLLGWAEAEQLISRASRRKQRVLRYLQSTAQSGTETRLRLLLQLHRIPVQAQVTINGVGRVDLLAGALVIEADSRQHHTGEDNYTRDRTRDLRLHSLGYRVLRLTYHQVMFDWEHTSQLVLALARAHRAQPQRILG